MDLCFREGFVQKAKWFNDKEGSYRFAELHK